MFYIQGLFLLNVTRAKQKNEHLNSIGREQQSWQGHCYLPFILRKETIVIIKMSSAADNSINTASFKGIRWYQEWCLKTNSYFFIFNHLLTAGLPRLARPPRPGTCLDSGFQYTLLKFMLSKKATKIDEIFTVDLKLCSKCQIYGEDFINFLWPS